jgi:membrane protease YdiL (CAAX protease family)
MTRNRGAFIPGLVFSLPYVGVLIGLVVVGSGWIAMLIYHLGVCLVFAAAWGRPSFGSLFRGWKSATGLWALPVFALAGLLIVVLWPVIRLEGGNLASTLASLGLENSTWWLFMIAYCLVNPWLEEWFWRGHAVAVMRRPGYSDILYAGYHTLVLVFFIKAPWVALAFVVLAGAGFVWRWMARKCGGLLLPALTHFVADVSVMIAAHVLAEG